MASGYSTALDTFPTNRQDDIDAKSGVDLGLTTTIGAHAQDHNDLADAINKIEAALGISPMGLYAATVRERFEIAAYKNQSVRAATSAATPAVTYANGTAGVGATLTATATGAWAAQDGVTLALADRFLVKNQAAPLQNGIYTVTTLGAVGVAMVLTRAIDADTSAKIADCKVLVDQGTANIDTEWYQSATAPTMGTTSLYFRRSQPIYGTGAPRSLWAPGSGPTVAQPIMETLPRQVAMGQWTIAVGATTQYLVGGIVCPAGRTVSSLNYLAVVAGAAPTVDYYALARQSDRQVMAVTANATAIPSTTAVTTRNFGAAWTPIEDTPVWIVIGLVNATTARIVPAAAGSAQSMAAANLIAPVMFGTNAVTPTTTPPAVGATITAATAGVVTSATVGFPYFWLT
jgi:hypothetical protein